MREFLIKRSVRTSSGVEGIKMKDPKKVSFVMAEIRTIAAVVAIITNITMIIIQYKILHHMGVI